MKLKFKIGKSNIEEILPQNNQLSQPGCILDPSSVLEIKWKILREKLGGGEF